MTLHPDLLHRANLKALEQDSVVLEHALASDSLVGWLHLRVAVQVHQWIVHVLLTLIFDLLKRFEPLFSKLVIFNR